MTDSYTPNDPSDDVFASFSSASPTVEGFVKPEIVAPGGHLVGAMSKNKHLIAEAHPEYASDAKKPCSSRPVHRRPPRW